MHLRPGIASVSMGRSSAGHSILEKIKQAKLHGFEGIEIFYECLESHAQTFEGGANEINLTIAAKEVRRCCDVNGMEVICLQPFTFYDGLTDARAHAKSIRRLHFWFQLAKILRTDLIQIPTNFLQEGTTGDLCQIVADCREAACLGLLQRPVIRFAYESVAWGTHIDIWETAWDVVKMVDLPNFGLCLDTFHIAGRVWGDPTSASGKTIDADTLLAETLEKMVQELDVSKIFYLQAGDAQRVYPPLNEGHLMEVPGQPPRMTWSRKARLFPFETERGGYLPIQDVLDTVLVKLGYNGWVSMEVFNEELFSRDVSVPSNLAARGERAWSHLVEVLDISSRLTCPN
jgi:4-hydroxyphenylpyruvate dioxygenase